MIQLGMAEIEIPSTIGGNVQRQAGLVRGTGVIPIHGMTSGALDEPAQPVLGEERF
jgi:hypothetical protein